MQGRHGTIIHSVKDPPSSSVTRNRALHAYKACHLHAHHHKYLNPTCRHMCNLLREPQGRRAETGCRKPSSGSSSPSHQVVLYNKGEKFCRHRGLHTHGRVTSKNTWDQSIYTSPEACPVQLDVMELERMALHPQPLQTLVDKEPRHLKAIARQRGRKSLYSFAVVPLPEKGETAAFNWLKNMGNAYGPSLMFLVGMGYWIQGFRCFPWLAVNFFFKDVLAVDPGTLQMLQNTVNLPMVAKPVYGIVSDAVYIRGAHRVPYLVMGGFLQALSWGTIAFLPGGGSSISIFAILLALSNLGASMVDVANDALVAECAKQKSTSELQSFAWSSAALGGVLGNLIAAFALSRVDFRLMFSMFGMLLVCQAGKSMCVNEGSFGLRNPRVMDKDIEKRIGSTKKKPVKCLPINGISSLERAPYSLAFEATENVWRQRILDGKRVGYASLRVSEEVEWRQTSIEVVSPDYVSFHREKSEALVAQEPANVAGMWQQFRELFDLVKKPEILYPLSWFMASYAMIPTLAGTMFFFQTQHLQIDPSVVGMAKVMGQVGLMGGSAVYSRYLKGMPLRKLLGSIQVLLCMCMMFDILLVKRMNVGLGIPDAVLVLGASAFVDAINQFKILPFMVLLSQLCPAGSEGSLLAAFMSVQCLATIISGYMGVSLASMLHITCDDFSELPTGILVQSMAALLPLFWISFIPDESRSGNGQKRDGKNS